jgi:hypothetical protein
MILGGGRPALADVILSAGSAAARRPHLIPVRFLVLAATIRDVEPVIVHPLRSLARHGEAR